MRNNRKTQMWFTDFVIATLLFLFVLLIYYAYSTNMSKRDSSAMDSLISDSKTISAYLTSGGFPDNWEASDVVRIGFTDDYNRIDNTKYREFTKINYTESKKLLGTGYDYYLFFVNESGDIQNVEGFCGVGYPGIIAIYDMKSAYYYKGAGKDQFLKDYMIDKFDADIYTEDGDEADAIGDFCDLTNRIYSYGLVVLEAPELPTGEPCGKFGAFKDAAETWVLEGGLFMISGELVAAQKREFAGGRFEKDAGLSSPQEHATVVNEDDFLDFALEDSLVFDQGFTVENTGGAINFKDIARFNESDIEFEDILDNKIAVARWDYGIGKVFFFSDFRAEYFAGDFQEELETATGKWIGARCLPIDMSHIERQELVRIDRVLIYDSDTLKMVLYVWY